VTLAEAVLGLTWVGVTLYAVFAGADFGAGLWDLVAGNARAGASERRLIERSIGPVWEANHVWLIFVLVMLWTGFPVAFAAVMSSVYVPLTAAGIGIILRGAGFAFRKSVEGVEPRRVFGAAFALSSIVTPFFFGAVAGAVASGRVPADAGEVGALESWVNPTSMLGGALAVATCGYLAAVFLAADASRREEAGLADHYRRLGLAAAAAAGVVATGGIVVLRADAELLYRGLTGRGLPLVVAAAAAGVASMVLLHRAHYQRARVATAAAVVAIVWGWAVAQYPFVLVGSLTIEEAAGSRATLIAMVTSLGVGALVFVPALIALLLMHVRGALGDDRA
jgi:cytochrome d ubiquinol oxidase subunit II